MVGNELRADRAPNPCRRFSVRVHSQVAPRARDRRDECARWIVLSCSDDRCDGSSGDDGKQGRRGHPHEAHGQHRLLCLLASGGASRERRGPKRGFPQVGARRGVNGRICDSIRFKTEDETFGILDHQLIFWVAQRAADEDFRSAT